MNRLACMSAAALLAAALPDPARAGPVMDDPFAGLNALDRGELGGLRGGMLINGIPVDFAIVIRTTVEGALAAAGLQTTIAINDQGGIGDVSTSAIGTEGALSDAPAGIAMSLSGDNTHILHRVIDGQVQAMVANRADAATINHQTQINVTMPGFQQMAQTHFAHSHTAGLNRDALMVGLGRF